jgi:3-phosphoshikimate 1-carboxyvinyltransferase
MNEIVYGTKKLKGSLTLPPDKSISHRAAMFAAIAEGESVIHNYSEAADPQSTLSCLKQLGVPITLHNTTVRITGVGREGLQNPEKDLDCGNSGTTMRLLSGILAGAGVKSRLVGDESLSSRTMKRIITPLNQMGASIRGRDDNYAPLEIDHSNKLRGMRYPLPIASAQLKSAVLLAGLFAENDTEVIESVPSRDHTERLLKLPVESYGSSATIRSNRSHQIPTQNYKVPGDFSAAAFWIVAGSIHPDAEIVLKDVGLNPSRTAALKILQEMGADIEIEPGSSQAMEPMGDVKVRSSQLRAVKLDPALVPNCIDELPILMIAMCFAEGRSEISGAEELRHKETDRLTAMANVLKEAGERFEEKKDGIIIQGVGNHYPDTGQFKSEHDHRIAMSAGVLAMMGSGKSEIIDAEATAISYPGFWKDLRLLDG